MSKSTLIQKLEEGIKPVVENMDYELYHIEYVKEGKENYLRLYIDKESGISLEDCEKVSRRISDLLDENDPIPDSYYLEVSSPGIERVLYKEEHLKKYIGYNIVLNLFAPIEKKKKYEGELTNFNKEEITIKSEEKEITIPRNKISKITLRGEF